MLITQNSYSNSYGSSYGNSNTCRPDEKFSALSNRQQYQAIEDLVDFAKGENNPGNKLKDLANQLGVKSAAHLSVGILDASDSLNGANAKSPIDELSAALGLRADDIECSLGKYVAEMAGNTRPGNNGSGGAVT